VLVGIALLLYLYFNKFLIFYNSNGLFEVQPILIAPITGVSLSKMFGGKTKILRRAKGINNIGETKLLRRKGGNN